MEAAGRMAGCPLIFQFGTTRDDDLFPGADVIVRKAEPFMTGL
jgi:hypothetical protein